MLFTTNVYDHNGILTAFANNPIVITAEVQNGDFVSNTTLYQLRLIVAVQDNYEETKSYSFSSQFTQNEEKIDIDISSAFVAWYMFRDRNKEPAHTDNGYEACQSKITAEVTYVRDGDEFTGTKMLVVEKLYVIRGEVPTRQRQMLGNPSNAVQYYSNRLSAKPTDEVRNIGDTHIVSSFNYETKTVESTRTMLTESNVASVEDTAITLEDNPRRREFFFRNRFGVIESVSAFAYEKKEVAMESERYPIVTAPSFAPKLNVMTKARISAEAYECSSGYVTEEWAKWWTEDFLTAEYHWMRTEIDGEEVVMPCHVEPSDDDVTLFDNTDNRLYEVVFKVEVLM